tara:strand:+ start:1209 stop:1799 length:591 start_codon:yes stop_codon:yes gene_type:complete
MASEVDICNSALNMIGASNIISLNEDSKAGRICNQRYALVRDAVFRSHPWNCLIQRVKLSPDSDTPSFDYSYQYTLPTDPYCLRVLRLQDPDTVHKIEGRKLLTDESSIEMIYLGRITDPNQYDQLLIEALSSRIAMEISYSLVNSTALTQLMEAQFNTKIREARFVDATEGTPENITNQDQRTYAEGDIFIASRF